MATPRPTPTRLRILKGNPGRRPLNDREPTASLLEKASPPIWLAEQAKEYWEELFPLLKAVRIVTEADVAGLASLSAAYATWRTAYTYLQQHGFTYQVETREGELTYRAYPQVAIEAEANLRLRRWLVEFGLTPSSRTKVSMVEDPQEEGKKLFQF